MFSKSSPKVTIMIPTYNQANLVSNAILSALNQDYDNLEIIISDDNSNDNTASIAVPFLKDNRVKYYKNYSNLGSIKNYQKTLYEYATGEWIVNLDGDDFLTNRSFISKAIQVVISDDSVGFVFSNYAIYDENDGSTIKIKNKELPSMINGKDFLLRFSTENIHWRHFSILYNRKSALKIGFYYDKQEARNDWESFLRLAVNNKVAYLNLVAGSWRKHGVNETSRTDIKKYLNNFNIIHSLEGFINKSNIMTKGESLRWSNAMIYKFSCDAIGAYFINKEYLSAVRFMRCVGKENRVILLKVIFSGTLATKLILSLYPPLYNLVKKIKYL